MRIDSTRLYAVRTGDVVGSSRLLVNERRKLVQVMKKGAEALRKVFGQTVLGVEPFRGDGWQMVIAEPLKSLRIGLFYRAFLRAHMLTNKVDTRMAIAIGRIDFIPGKRVSAGDGEAFRSSGVALEGMSRHSRMWFVLANNEDSVNVRAIEVIFSLIDVLAMNWTEKQAHAVTGI